MLWSVSKCYKDSALRLPSTLSDKPHPGFGNRSARKIRQAASPPKWRKEIDENIRLASSTFCLRFQEFHSLQNELSLVNPWQIKIGGQALLIEILLCQKATMPSRTLSRRALSSEDKGRQRRCRLKLHPWKLHLRALFQGLSESFVRPRSTNLRRCSSVWPIEPNVEIIASKISCLSFGTVVSASETDRNFSVKMP